MADKTAAERQRRWRRRQAGGKRAFRLILDQDAVALVLLQAGILVEDKAGEHSEVESALEKFVKAKIL